MSSEENKALVLRFIEEVQNQHKLDALDEIFSPDFIDHSGSVSQPGIEGARTFFAMGNVAFPDLHFSVKKMVAEGDLVVTYKTFHGTHLGSFMGIAPTGRQISFDLMDIFAVHDGKITDHWKVQDALAMMRQLGVLPEPA